MKSKGKMKCRIDDNGRECTGGCGYLPWSEFENLAKGSHGKTPNCKKCRKKERDSMKGVKKVLYQKPVVEVVVRAPRPLQDFSIVYGDEIYM